MKKQFCGYISIVGKPNVGKSTLLNTILDKKISITSRKSQTTRNNILGVKTDEEFQMIFLDTPGIHLKATKTLNKVLNHSALSVIEDSDLVLFVIQRTSLQDQDRQVLNKIKETKVPSICVLNKIDQVQNKNDLLPLIQEIDSIYPFSDYVPISAKNHDGIEDLLECIKTSLPENNHLYPADPEDKEIPDNFFISELVREKIIRSLGDELPHETYVSVETKAMKGKMLSIGVIIYVARDSQKSIVIGHEGSMTRNFAPNGVLQDYAPTYYARRAEGGVGLILTEGVEVSHRAASGYPNVPNLESDDAKKMWEKVVSEVHKNNSSIFCQLWHVGGIRKPGMPPIPEIPGFTPSGYVVPGKKVAHEMTHEEIKELIEIYANDAKICEEIGFDGVEIHGAHGYLIDQFFWDQINLRTDEYGGSIENRARLAKEILEVSKKITSDNFKVGIRVSQWKQQDYEAKIASDPKELNKFFNILKDAGADFIHCSNRRFWEGEFDSEGLNLAGVAKEATGLPTISVGSVGLDKDFIKLYSGDHKTQTADLSALHERLNKSEFDLIAVGRALLSDPDWANKVQDGKEDQIVPFDKSFVENYV